MAIRTRKCFPAATMVFAGLCLLAASCAESPTEPVDQNNSPYFFDEGIVLAGGKPIVAEGDQDVLLEALAADYDGADTLRFTWSGDGLFFGQNNEDQTVHWRLPASGYGNLTVTCVVDDGTTTASYTDSFPVGRGLTADDYGDIVGDEVHWSADDTPFYILQSDVTIPADLTLRVGEGLVVWCESGKTLTVQGGLIIEGTSGLGQVVFKAYSQETTSNNWWEGIVVDTSSDLLQIQWANIYNACIGINLRTGAAPGAEIGSTLLQYCDKGIVASYSALALSVNVKNCRQGILIEYCELELSGCNFTDNEELSLMLGTESWGSCQGSIFNGAGTASILMSGMSYVDFHDNSFIGETVFSVGGGYGGEDAPYIDARCNYWGPDSDMSSISEAIVYTHPSDAANVSFMPFKESPSSNCGSGEPAPELLSGIYVDGPNHPLWEDPEVEVDLSQMGFSYPPRLLRIDVVESTENFLYHYEWETPDEGKFYYQGEMDFDYFWPGQADDLQGSSIFFISYTPDSVSVSVTVTDTWGRSVQADSTFVY